MDNTLLSKALWLESPRYVKESKLDINTGQYDIHIDFEKGSKFEIDGKLHGVYQTRERTVKHLFMRQYETYLHIRMPIIKTSTGTSVIECPLMRKWSGFSYLFEALVVDLAKNLAVSQIGKQLKIHQKSVMNIVTHYVKYSKENADYSEVTHLWVDETSFKKKHDYITVWVNINTGRIIEIADGKWADTLGVIKKTLERKWWEGERITDISIDMSKSFIAWAKKYFPNASVTFDRFHVMKLMGEVMDKVRRSEAVRFKLLKWTRYLRLYDREKLKWNQKQEIDSLLELNKALATVYQLKENLKIFYLLEESDNPEAYLRHWCKVWIQSWIPIVHNLVKTIKRHWRWIVNYSKSQVTNWILEWINSIIQLAKKRARWYRNKENMKIIAFLLKWDFPILAPTY